MGRRSGSFGRDRRGSVALIFGLAAPVLGIALAAAMDLNAWWSAKVKLQVAADGAALAAAREMQLATATAPGVSRVAEQYVRAKLADDGLTPTIVSARAAMKARTVQVDVSAEVNPLFSRALHDGVKVISTKANARLTSRAPVCVVGLDPRLEGTLSFKSGARLTADRCAVYSNSASRGSIDGDDRSRAAAAMFCATGGYTGRKSSFAPDPMTDCPVLADPLKDREPPPIGGCTATNMEIRKEAVTLTPGTYCGGLRVTDKGSVTLLSGIYVIKDGPLVVNKKSSLQGQNVGLFFAGDKASLLFDQNSVVSLTAPRDGPMAGLLMSEERRVEKPEPAPTPTDPLEGIVAGLGGVVGSLLAPLLPPGAPPMREYRILSDEARTLLGTIYLPSGRLMIDSKKAVADRSAYTVIVVRRLELFEGPDLYLNSNYGMSDIPVPKGVGPIAGAVALTK